MERQILTKKLDFLDMSNTTLDCDLIQLNDCGRCGYCGERAECLDNVVEFREQVWSFPCVEHPFVPNSHVQAGKSTHTFHLICILFSESEISSEYIEGKSWKFWNLISCTKCPKAPCGTSICWPISYWLLRAFAWICIWMCISLENLMS